MDWLNAAAGFGVGALVGMTGVGGGSLMAPIMILLFGVSPHTAVGTDLWFAAITKSVGGAVHHNAGGADWEIVRRLSYGSLPAAVLTLLWLSYSGQEKFHGGTITFTLGVVLMITAVATLFRHRFHKAAAQFRRETASGFQRFQPSMTVVAGAVLGVMVTLTSVGAGALGATMLLALYPLRLTPHRLVGTDIVHAVPLTIVGGLGHLLIGNVNFSLLGGLLLGSIPGIIAGSLLASRASERVLRPVLAAVLMFAGVKLLG